jgi:hypothetical protein
MAALLFGCTGGGSGANGAQQTQAQGAGAQGGGSAGGSSGGASGGSGTGGASGGGGAATQTPAAQTSGSDPFSGKGYDALLKLGLPAECDVTMDAGGSPAYHKMYFSGGDENTMRIRIETTVQVKPAGGVPYSSVSIVKDKKMYTTVMEALRQTGLYPNCDWMVVDPSEYPQQQQSNPDSYKSVPPTNFKCKAWVVDASKFETPGGTCSMKDMIPAGLPQTP